MTTVCVVILDSEVISAVRVAGRQLASSRIILSPIDTRPSNNATFPSLIVIAAVNGFSE
jgi:hypothetical protein